MNSTFTSIFQGICQNLSDALNFFSNFRKTTVAELNIRNDFPNQSIPEYIWKVGSFSSTCRNVSGKKTSWENSKLNLLYQAFLFRYSFLWAIPGRLWRLLKCTEFLVKSFILLTPRSRKDLSHETHASVNQSKA